MMLVRTMRVFAERVTHGKIPIWQVVALILFNAKVGIFPYSYNIILLASLSFIA